MGDRLIHIHEKVPLIVTPRGGREWGNPELAHHLCKSRLSEMEHYESYAAPVVFKDRWDMHTRPRQEVDSGNPHCRCGSWHYLDAPHIVDLSILQLSREARYEGLQFLYKTNSWSFAQPAILDKWLARTNSPATRWSRSLMPPQNLAGSIRHLRFEMKLYQWVYEDRSGTIWTRGEQTDQWRDLLLRLPSQFPRLLTLHVAICLGGYVTCHRLSRGNDITGMFRPLRLLRGLKVFTVVVNDAQTVDRCTSVMHDEETQRVGGRYTFFERKEVRRVWAEEMRGVVLGGEMEAGR